MDVILKNILCQVGPYFCIKPHCPQFLHTSCKGLISACKVNNPCHIPLFLYLIKSCHYLLHFLYQLHAIRKCFTSSTSSPSHSVHFLSSLFKPLYLPTSMHLQFCCTLLGFVTILLIFFLTPIYIILYTHLISSFNTHSSGRNLITSSHVTLAGNHKPMMARCPIVRN